MKILGIDYGEKRIGLALSDDTRLIAAPLKPLNVDSISDAVAKLYRIISSHNISEVVVGLPLSEDRSETQQSLKTRYFVNALKSINSVDVNYWNEYLTTQNAQNEAGSHTGRYKRSIDSEAARQILQEYLDHLKENPTATAPNFNYQTI